MTDQALKNTIMSIFIADALGSASDSMGRGHVSAHYREMDGYRDPAPALKGRMDRWKKPGLYTSISQFMALGAMHMRGGSFAREEFLHTLSRAPEVMDSTQGIFRGTDPVERSLTQRARERDQSPPPVLPSCRIIPAAAAFVLLGASRVAVFDYLALFSLDISTITGGLVFAETARRLLGTDDYATDNYRHEGAMAAEDIGSMAQAAPEEFFNRRINPGKVADFASEYCSLLNGIGEERTPAGAEKRICDAVNKHMKTPVTRATVNDPLAQVAFSLSFLDIHKEDDYLLYKVASEGGTNASLCAMCGALAAASGRKDHIREELVTQLINRRRILAFADSVPDTSGTGEFMQAEAMLTAKETEERAARMKHTKDKSPARKNREARIDSLNRHVVESWTKIDRAKWKKDRRKADRGGHDD